MKMFAALCFGCLVLAGCESCNPQPSVNAGVGVGTGGVSGGVSVGASCGPLNVSVGGGNYYHVAF